MTKREAVEVQVEMDTILIQNACRAAEAEMEDIDEFRKRMAGLSHEEKRRLYESLK